MTDPGMEQGCDQCPHQFLRHRLVKLGEDIHDGGVIVCPSRGCRCVHMWAVAGQEHPPIPEVKVLTQIWAYVQGGHAD